MITYSDRGGQSNPVQMSHSWSEDGGLIQEDVAQIRYNDGDRRYVELSESPTRQRRLYWANMPDEHAVTREEAVSACLRPFVILLVVMSRSCENSDRNSITELLYCLR